MATLILSTAGTALFGPIGGAIGAIIGQQIDNELFKPKGREGPRLNDVRLQTSSYGTPLPKIFGTMRVAGTVVWATDLQEDRNKEGGGKGRPSTTTYSYSASFAVALSARPIRAVHRIWADGKLPRDAGVFSFWNGLEWRDGELLCDALVIAGQTVVREQQVGVPDVSGGSVIDAEARIAIASILGALRAHGLIAT